MTEAAWRRRFRAARVSLPVWAVDAPERAVYATNASGVWQLVAWDLTRDGHRTVTDKPTGVRAGRPTPDGSGVVWFDDHAGDEVGRHVVTPFHGGGPVPLVSAVDEGWSAGLSLRGDRIAVGVAGKDGFTLSVADPSGTRPVYHHTQPADVAGLSRDGALLAITHTEHGDVLHPALRVLDGDGDVVGERSDGPGITTVPAGWSPVVGDERLAVVTDASGRERPEVWTPATGERVALSVDLPGDVWVADWWPDASALLLGHDHLGRTELLRYDLDHRLPTPLPLGPAGQPGSGTVAAAAVRPDGTIWYAFTSSADPPVIRRHAADEPGVDEVLLHPPGDPAPGGAAYESLHYDNGEGGRVHAFLAQPPGNPPHPLVVDVHGGPQAQTTDSFDPEVQAWVDHGFAVLMPNYRGSTGYGKEWEDAIQGDPGRPELVDLRAGRDHLVAAGLADAERLVVSGASWGGYLALLAIGTQPHAWGAAVAVVPVADYHTAYADESPALQRFDSSLFGGGPEDKPDLYTARSPITHVDCVQAPVIIITGRNDTRCPQQQVDNYVTALADRGVPHAYHLFDAGHGSLQVEETINQVGHALDFVATHLGTPPAAP